MKHTIKAILSLIFAAVLAVAPAVAQEDDKSGIYVSPEAGVLIYRIDEDGTETDESGTGFGVSGGYRVNNYFAAEGGFRYAQLDLGSSGGELEIDATSWSLGLRGFFDISDSFAITGKAGWHFWDVDAEETDAGDVTKSSADGNDPYFGIGVESRITDSVAFRAEYTRFILNYDGDDEDNFADADADLISASVVWSF